MTRKMDVVSGEPGINAERLQFLRPMISRAASMAWSLEAPILRCTTPVELLYTDSGTAHKRLLVFPFLRRALLSFLDLFLREIAN